MNFIKKLEKMYACPSAITWLKRRRFRTFQQAWNKCHKPEWMRWYLTEIYRKRGLHSFSVVRYPMKFSKILLEQYEVQYEEEPNQASDMMAADRIRKAYPKPPPSQEESNDVCK